MEKIPTLFKRDPADMAHVLNEVNPECEWVLAGEGYATRKFDGTCMAKIEGVGWVARREVKPGKTPPPNFIELSTDPNTGKAVGWEPAEQSSFAKFWREATEGKHADYGYGTYELCGPKINGNPEGFEKHVLVRHGSEVLPATPATFEGLRETLLLVFAPRGWEGWVWHHDDGVRMAKLKVRDFPADA